MANFWNTKNEDATIPDVTGANVLGHVIGLVSLLLTLAGIGVSRLLDVSPFIGSAMSNVGDVGIAVALGLIWFGERGHGPLAAIGLILAALAAIGLAGVSLMYGVIWLADTLSLNGPDSDIATSALFILGVIAPMVFGFVVLTKWIERRSGS